MIMKANKQIGFININEESIDKILKDGDVVFEKGFLREKTSTTLPITFGGVGKDLKDYKVYGNTVQNSTSGKNICLQANIVDTNTIRFDINSNEINRTFTLSLIPPLSVNSMSIVAFADGVNLRSVGTINLISGERSTTTITLTESIYNTIQNASEVHFNLYKSGAGISTTSIIEEPQIENNSSFTSYEPYTGGQPSPNPNYPQEIVSCGDLITDSQDENYGKYKIPVNVRSENLFDKDNMTLNEYIRNDGTTLSTDYWDISNYIELEPNKTYTYNGLTSIGTSSVQSAYYDINKNFISTFKQAVGTTTITTPSNAYYVRFSINKGANDKNTFQFKQGSTVPSKYIPYYNETTNIYLDEPLRGIGEYSDYVDFINGKVVRNIGETVLNGSETWNKIGTISNHFMYFYSTLLDATAIKNLTKIMFSNKFKVYEGQLKYNVPVNTDSINISNNDDTQRLRILIAETRLPSYTTDNFKSWLQSNNVTVDYVLETPTEETITLPNIPTIDGNNTLNIETEITPSQVYIKYKSNT